MKIVESSVKLISLTANMYDIETFMVNPQELIERAGRTCYKSNAMITKDTAGPFVKNLKKLGHESVFEHASAGFRIVCDRGVSHEIVRHRIASYSQESTRYCNYAANKFGCEITVIKPSWLNDELLEKIKKIYLKGLGFYGTLDETGWRAWYWYIAMGNAEKSYNYMLKSGAVAQEARAVLPNSLKTEIVMTANFREWKHFLKLRCAKAAHPDMRVIANMIKDILVKICPEIFDESEAQDD